TFPLPGRKQRAAPESNPALPKSKAQQILGSAGINIDSPSQWDAASNSGISISVSESTASHHPGERTRGHRNDLGSKAGSRWEQESDIVPAHLKHSGSRPAGNETIDHS